MSPEHRRLLDDLKRSPAGLFFPAWVECKSEGKTWPYVDAFEWWNTLLESGNERSTLVLEHIVRAMIAERLKGGQERIS